MNEKSPRRSGNLLTFHLSETIHRFSKIRPPSLHGFASEKRLSGLTRSPRRPSEGHRATTVREG